MSGRNAWLTAYYALFAAILATGALNMMHVRGGFFTNHAADIAVPAWLYVAARGLHSTHGRKTFIQRVIGQTPEFAALSLFAASAVTEVSQLYWPRGVFPGRFDVLDLVAYAGALAACYGVDKRWPRISTVPVLGSRPPAV